MKKNNIEIKDAKFLLNGKPFFVYSGEIHYFRVPKDKWADRLRKAKETGLNTISTYIPWSWHEVKEGEFDFTGRTGPQRDIVAFIKMVNDSGLFLTARIGPIANAEIKGEGTPIWFLENHQEARAKNQKGANALHEAMVSYMNPVFQKYVSRWYSKICPIVNKNMVQKGGPIIMVQIDNEIGMMNWVMNSPDYNETTTRMYQNYLEELYKGDIALVNEKYYMNHNKFEEILQPKGDVDEEGVIRCWDWVHFYTHFYAKYYQFLAKMAKDYKINLPFVANISMFWDYNMCARSDHGIMTILQFRDFIKFTPNVIFGGAYQMRNLNFDNFHDAILMTEGINMISDTVAPKICVETQVGGMNDRPRIYPSDINLLVRYAMGHGLNGLNFYMFCGGTNELDFGFRGSYHEWQSPVDSHGKKTPRIKPLEDMGEFVKTFGSNVEDTKKEYDFAIGLYAPYYETSYLKGSVVDNMVSARNKFFFDGIVRLLTLNGYSYKLVDLERVREKDMSNIPAMWVFALDYMDKKTQMKLAEYVKKGGTVIMSPAVPTKDMGLMRDETFLREIEVSVSETIKDNLVFVSDRDYYVEGDIKIFDSKKRRIVARTRDKKPCGILKKVRKGKVLLLGFGVMHLLDYYMDMTAHFMEMLNIEPRVKVTPPDVHAVVRSNKKYGFLFLCNFNDDPREVTVNLRIPDLNKTVTIPQDAKIMLPNRSACILPLNLPVSKRIKIRYSTAEILRLAATEKNLKLDFHGCCGSMCEILIEMKKPRGVSLDGREISFKYKDGLLKLSFELTGKLQNLTII